jgi:hypothetical protein
MPAHAVSATTMAIQTRGVLVMKASGEQVDVRVRSARATPL